MFKTFVILLCFAISGCYVKTSVDSFKTDLLELHNKERISRGYSKLKLDENLCLYAQKHAEYMDANEKLVHSKMSDLIKVNKDSSIVGENIAWGQESESEVISSWMWSPMHRWNILGSSFKRIGFGMKKGENNKKYWCVVFSD